MILYILLGLLGGLVIAGGVGWAMFQRRQSQSLTTHLEESAQKAFGTVVQEMVKTARDQLGAEKREISETIARDLKVQTDAFREISHSLRQEIDIRQREIRVMEEDRNKKYGQIAQALTDYKTLTEELRVSTEQLKRVLASNQLRGSWGEMQAERILNAAGMTEGHHYQKQKVIESEPSLRPDFTIFLPNKMQLYVDVKFPLQSLQLALNTENKAEQSHHLQQFGTDLKQRIKEAGKYVLNTPSSVDYVILFVPSESVFEIINKHFSSVIDGSFSERVILASPHSFFAIVRTIQESYNHFYYEQNLRDILHYLQQTLQQFERFKGEFADVGKALQVAQSKYDQLVTTRYRQIDRLTTKINTYDIEKGDPTPVSDALPLELPDGSTEDTL